MLPVRPAHPADVPAIAALQALCWPDQPARPAQVAEALAARDHAISVFIHAGALAGFVGGFLTRGAAGTRRWEIDLLAVHPDQRGQGVGRALIGASMEAGRRFEPHLARALIRLDNHPSQRVFARAGFVTAPPACRLMVAIPRASRTAPDSPPGAHLIPVCTLSYRGVWVEGARQKGAFIAAQAMRARQGWDVAGSVIPLDDSAALEAALAAGYVSAGKYAWWTRFYA